MKTKINKKALKKGSIINSAMNEYKLVNKIGQGGNGKVYLAVNKNSENVAIKIINKNKNEENIKRFLAEIDFCKNNSHENIIKMIDSGYSDEGNYVFGVMPYYDSTLRKRMGKRIPYSKVVDIIIGVLKGLEFIHRKRIIHRDIKPANILFNKGSWVPIITDFGIAHYENNKITNTKHKTRLANFDYCAPEQKKGKCFYQSDIYSLGLIMNEIFTRQIPQAGGYKKIREINKEYAYLDILFEKIFKQNYRDRLYPETKIIELLFNLTKDREKIIKLLSIYTNKLEIDNEINTYYINIYYKHLLGIYKNNSIVIKDMLINGLKNNIYVVNKYSIDIYNVVYIKKNITEKDLILLKNDLDSLINNIKDYYNKNTMVHLIAFSPSEATISMDNYVNIFDKSYDLIVYGSSVNMLKIAANMKK